MSHGTSYHIVLSPGGSVLVDGCLSIASHYLLLKQGRTSECKVPPEDTPAALLVQRRRVWGERRQEGKGHG